MAQQKNKKYNFSKIESRDLDNNPLVFNIAKDFGNELYKATPNLEGLDLAQRIHKNGEVELTSEDKSIIRAFVKSTQCAFIAVVKAAILDAIKDDLEG